MTQEYSRACLRVAVAQICQHLGWNSIHATPMELLTDVLERYLVQVGKTTHRYSEQFGRTDARLEDVFMAFTHMGVQVHELEDFAKHVDPLPFAKEIVSYPTPQENDLKFPNPDSKEVQQRKVFEYVPEYLPYMHPELNEEEPEDTNQSARPVSPERLQVEPQAVELSPSPGDKRPVSSPGDGSVPPFKRQRLTTSQPLPEEASQSQYEMTSVVMTHSGILSPIREGKVPDSKAPPSGFKQIVIVRQKNAGQATTPGIHLPTDASVIKLDFNKDPNKSGKIVEVGDKAKNAGAFDFDRNDPEYRPKMKKKMKEFKRDKTSQKPFKIKRGPGRPRSPGRAAVVHTKGFPKIPAVSMMNPMPSTGQDGPIDLSLKPTPPPPNISVVKTEDQGKEPELLKYLDYKPKVTSLSKQQERDYEDTIDSVIGNKSSESDFDKSVHRESSVSKEKKSKAVDEWRVSHISESYVGEDDEESGNKSEPSSRSESDSTFTSPPPTTIAPHLKFLYSGTPAASVSPRPRGRPRGSGSGFYRSYAGRSPMSGRRGRPPLHRGSPGRPPLNRSPGRPPLNRSPGRPPLNRSPGRPSSGRSPGRPKGSGLSPRPRGRPRGSKSPRSRGASPRGGSPRAISHLKFDENNDSNDSKTNIFKLDNDDSEATLSEFPSQSPVSKSPEKKMSPVRISRTPSADDRSSSMPSPAPTEPAESSGSRDASPGLSPTSVHSVPFGRVPTPDDNTRFPSSKESSPVKEVRDVSKERSWETEIKQEQAKDYKEKYNKEKSWERDYKESSREYKGTSRDSDFKESSRELDYKEHSRDRDIGGYKKEHKEKSRDREKEHNRDKERDYKERYRDKDHKEHSKDRDREHKEHYKDKEKEHREKEHKEYSRDREFKEHRDREVDKEYKDRDKDIREKEYKEHSKDRDRKEHSKDREHKEHSRDRDSKEHSKDRDRDRSKEHRKDKKKKKKKNKDREKEKEEDLEKKEKHKEKKEREREKDVREESPSVIPLQKLKIKFGGGSSSTPTSFSISTSKSAASPKPGSVSPVHRPEIPKLKFKMLPPKPDATAEGDKSWVSSIKKEKSVTPKHESESPRVSPGPGSRTISPKPKYSTTSGSDNSDDDDVDGKGNKSGEEEVTVSVVKGKVIVKKPSKRGKRKGSGKKGRPKGEGFKREESGLLFGEHTEGLVAAIKREPEKEASPISPPFSPQNVPSPITIPALKAAPPPPSPPQPAKKISPPKPRSLLKEQKPMSPLVKELLAPKPTPVPVAKVAKVVKSPRKLSPKKSPKISPTTKKKGSMSPPKTSPSKTFPYSELPSSRTPSPQHGSSPSPSVHSSPMYSPASSPARNSPLHFQMTSSQIPFPPSRTHSPSPVSRQISTDDEIESASSSKLPMPPPELLPPMPPTSAQKRAQRTVITETVGTFVNESGEKIWICPACTMQDDGSPMIGCDICDEWYHWVCVGIEKEPSEDSSWYCPKCVKPNKSKSKRGRKKKKI